MKKIKEVRMKQVCDTRKPAARNTQDCCCRSKRKKRFCISLKRKLRAARVAPALPYMRVQLCLEQRKEVTAVRYYNVSTDGYPICPSCGYALEREFQNHCEECGQLLGWKKFSSGKITVQRILGKESATGSFDSEKNYGDLPVSFEPRHALVH